jgi:hypothetical protein
MSKRISAVLRRAVVAAGLSLAFLIALRLIANGEALVSVRNALFTTYVSDSTLFSASPRALLQHGFLIDPPKLRERYLARVRLATGVTQALDSLQLVKDAISKAKGIVLLFSNAGFAGKCGTSDDLEDKFRLAQKGFGCCSDHSKLFQATANSMGLVAREVQTSNHAVGSFFDPQRGKWVFIDPTLAVMAYSPEGVPLSVLELRARMLLHDTVRFEFFGGANHPRSMESGVARQYYGNPVHFRRLVVAAGSNVLEQEAFLTSHPYMPKPVAQLALQLTGIRPRFWSLRDDFSEETIRAEQRFRIAGILGLALLLALASWWITAPVRGSRLSQRSTNAV